MLLPIAAAVAILLLTGRKKGTSNAVNPSAPNLFEPAPVVTNPTTGAGGGIKNTTIPPVNNSVRFQYSATQDSSIAFKRLSAINNSSFIAFVFSPTDNRFLLSEPKAVKKGDTLPGLTTGRTITDLNTGTKYYHVGFEYTDSTGNKKAANIAAPVKDFQLT